jgi:hypothetical protein
VAHGEQKGNKMKMMVLALGGLLLAGVGCATKVGTALPDLVGPCGPGAAPGAVDGHLMVYSCWDFSRPADYDYDYVMRTPYNVYLPDGQLLQQVQNDSGGFDRDPVSLMLPPGEYAVTSFVTGQGEVRVPVLIRRGQTTVVHLDGRANYLRSQAPLDSLVRLPNGDIIGCRAAEGIAAK